MSLKKGLKYVVFFCLVGLLAGGCGTFKGGKKKDPGLGSPDPLDGDYALDARFDEIGTRITGPAVEFGTVMFEYDSSRIDSSEVSKIERAAAYMQNNTAACLITEGHCDERGSREYNMSLGENRALAVRARLIQLGVKEKRIQTRSYGEERPVDPGHGEASWRQNRRVEFAVFSID
jgi:peptidoglycan-associated lipoprotein